MVRGGDGSGQRPRRHKAYPTSTLDEFKRSVELYEFTLNQGRSDMIGSTMDHGTTSHMTQAYGRYRHRLTDDERLDWRKYFEPDYEIGAAASSSSASKSTATAVSTSASTSASTPTLAPASSIKVRDVVTHPSMSSK